MLSDNLRHLRAQVEFYHRRGGVNALGDLIIERLGVYADDAAHLEAAAIPASARVHAATAEQMGENVVPFDKSRRAGRG